MAETVCLRALRVLDPAQYAEALACYLAKLENELPLLFDARRLCYYTGTVLCLTLERLGLPFYNDFTGTTLYEQNRPTDALCFEAPEVPALAALFAEHLKEQQTTLAAHRQARPFHPCEAGISGFTAAIFSLSGRMVLPSSSMAPYWRSSPPAAITASSAITDSPLF